MSQATAVKSMILDPQGSRAESPTSAWRAPGGQSPYFGWLGADGFTTVRVDRIQALFPQMKQVGQFSAPEPTGNYVIVQEGVQLVINDQDALRLMKRMGWIEPGEMKH
jgi:hypothetical protein